jgi:hypothetical protein
MDGFYKNILHHKVFAFYEREEFAPAKKLVIKMSEAVGFGSGGVSVLRILKSVCFKFTACSYSRKLLMEFSDIVALGAVFLRTVHEIRQIVGANVYCSGETWVNQNHTHKSFWKMSGGSGSLQVPVSKGGGVIMYHAGSTDRGFVLEILIFPSKS